MRSLLRFAVAAVGGLAVILLVLVLLSLATAGETSMVTFQ